MNAKKFPKRIIAVVLTMMLIISCFALPMTGMFRGMADGGTSRGGTIALVAWCAYFLPVGLLAWRHFN